MGPGQGLPPVADGSPEHLQASLSGTDPLPPSGQAREQPCTRHHVYVSQPSTGSAGGGPCLCPAIPRSFPLSWALGTVLPPQPPCSSVIQPHLPCQMQQVQPPSLLLAPSLWGHHQDLQAMCLNVPPSTRPMAPSRVHLSHPELRSYVARDEHLGASLGFRGQCSCTWPAHPLPTFLSPHSKQASFPPQNISLGFQWCPHSHMQHFAEVPSAPGPSHLTQCHQHEPGHPRTQAVFTPLLAASGHRDSQCHGQPGDSSQHLSSEPHTCTPKAHSAPFQCVLRHEQTQPPSTSRPAPILPP